MAKHTIFDSYNFDYEALNEFLAEEYPEIKEGSNTYWQYVSDEISIEWETECDNMSEVKAYDGMIILADIGRWNGRHSGYAEVKGYTVKDAITTPHDYDDIEIYVEGDDLHMTMYDHDGRTYATVREWRHNLSDEQKEHFMDALYYGKATESMINWYTKPIGKKIAKYYGWKGDKGMTVKETINRVQEATA